MRIVFFGTPKFAADILSFLLTKNIEVAAVVTRPDKPQKRSKELIVSPVKALALSHALPVYQPRKASHPDFVSFLNTLHADLFIVAAFAEIVKENVLKIPRLGCINVHASLLPKYRGAAPINWAIMEGEKETGVTIMKMAAEVDAGEIYAVEKTLIEETMTAGELTDELAKLGASALWNVLKKIEAGSLISIQQEHAKATYAKKLHLEDGEIHWHFPASTVFNRIRAVTPKPGAWTWIWIDGTKKRILIKKAVHEKNLSGIASSLISKNPYELLIACQEGAIRLLRIQLEGKKEMEVAAFLRGTPIQKVSFMNPSQII